jgi:predicted RNase H-like HicB family nuclease/predicted RNA binding protein YcfA (HicA-like mRNA interferase family)
MADSVLFQVLRGSADANIRFSDLRGLLLKNGFVERVKGSHHIFTHDAVAEILKSSTEKLVCKTLSGETSAQDSDSISTGRWERMTKYEIILYWSTEDEAFIAEVPELGGCAADGSTRQEALASVEVVIARWLETARELGRSIPEPKGRLLFA